MDKFLRFYIKFYGYCMAAASVGFSIYFTSFYITRNPTIPEKLVDFRFTKIPAIVFGLAWMIASSLLLVGVFKEKLQLLYPFLVLFAIDLVLMLLRIIYVLINSHSSNVVAFLIIHLPILLFVITYVILTMLAQIKLFTIDPIVTAESNFVRFDRNPSDEANPESVTIYK